MRNEPDTASIIKEIKRNESKHRNKNGLELSKNCKKRILKRNRIRNELTTI